MIYTIFWIAFSFILYTYLLYPIIILTLSRVRKRPVRLEPVGDTLPAVTMIIVVYNEEDHVEEKIRNCLELDYPRDLLTICFVSDGSTDLTNEILRRHDEVVLIEDSKNRGKPHQLNRAAAYSKDPILAFSDVRQIYEPNAIRTLVRNFSDPEVGAVSGELTFRRALDHTEQSIGLYWRYEKALRKAESAVDSTLGVTGAIYAIRRELFAPIPTDTILDDIEIPLHAFEMGYRVIFEPEAKAYDTAPSRIDIEFRRKVRTLTGNFQLFRRNMWLFNPAKNRILIQAVSHKLFRLIVP